MSDRDRRGGYWGAAAGLAVPEVRLVTVRFQVTSISVKGGAVVVRLEKDDDVAGHLVDETEVFFHPEHLSSPPYLGAYYELSARTSALVGAA